MESTLSVLTRLLGTEPVTSEDLGGSAESVVLRFAMADGRGAVAKHFTGGDAAARYTREIVGLRHLDRTPALLTRDDDALLLVMADVGTAETLADHLLGDDADAAWASAISWAGALGDIAGRSIDRIPAIRAELEGLSVFDPAPVLREGAAALAELTGTDPALLDGELHRLEELLGGVGAEVAWPTDTCPDNAVAGESGWTFLDLEGTDVHHAALVAAYPALPFATCWCVFDPPPGLTDQMLAAFTLALSGHAPHITDRPEWREEVDLGSLAWILATTAWLLPRALEGDGPIGPEGRPSPTRRQLLRSRWRWLAQRPEGSAVATVGLAALAWTAEHWEGEPDPGGYPAFAEPASDVDETNEPE